MFDRRFLLGCALALSSLASAWALSPVADRVLFDNQGGTGLWMIDLTTSDVNPVGDGNPEYYGLFGAYAGRIPLIADLNNDGISDRVVVADITGCCAGWDGVLSPTSGNPIANGTPELSAAFGAEMAGGATKPLIGDFDGNGTADRVIYTLASASFAIDLSGSAVWGDGNPDRYYAFGVAGDVPFTGDFNGDGLFDIGIYRITGGNGDVYIDLTANATTMGDGVPDISFSVGPDQAYIPTAVNHDFDADGKADLLLTRKQTGCCTAWFAYYSKSNFSTMGSDVFGGESATGLAGHFGGVDLPVELSSFDLE